MIAGFNEDETGIWTVPSGKTAYITRWQIGPGKSAAKRMCRSWFRASCDIHPNYSGNKFHTKDLTISQDMMTIIPFDVPVKCPSRTDIKISIISPDGTSIMVGSFEGWYE